MLSISNDYAKMYNNTIRLTSKYARENNIQSLVLGISGGIDSALTAALASVVCKENNIPLIGLSMPILTNKDEEVTRAAAVGEAFCQKFVVVSGLDKAYYSLYNILADEDRQKDDSLDEKICRGNIKARLRMITLYDTARVNKGLVLSTDNFTELMLGFWTICGDVGDWGMLQNLWKTEVYGLANWLADGLTADEPGISDKVTTLRACIAATPTDGLGVSSSDFEQLGVNSYEEIDLRLLNYLKDGISEPDCPVVARSNASAFKRSVPINLSRAVVLGNTDG